MGAPVTVFDTPEQLGWTLAGEILDRTRAALTPMANAIGTLILMMTIGTTLVALWLTRYRG